MSRVVGPRHYRQVSPIIGILDAASSCERRTDLFGLTVGVFHQEQ